MSFLGFLRRLMQRSDRLGRRGEREASRFLRRRGFRIVLRNFNVGRYEADLITIDPDGRTLAIVEVKTRRGLDAQAAPQERVDRQKRLHLTAIAAKLMKSKRFAGRPVRFDVVAVVLSDRGEPIVRHIPAAFDSEI